ncbi:MAG: hypothetical protein V4710_20430 [Verrucomicrobiota bacterium]
MAFSKAPEEEGVPAITALLKMAVKYEVAMTLRMATPQKRVLIITEDRGGTVGTLKHAIFRMQLLFFAGAALTKAFGKHIFMKAGIFRATSRVKGRNSHETDFPQATSTACVCGNRLLASLSNLSQKKKKTPCKGQQKHTITSPLKNDS